jgi:quinol monooxygenase YgiN
VTRNQDDPTNFIFVEQWDSRQHYERYFAWRQETGVLDQLAGMIRGQASFRFFDYVGL